VTHSHTHTHTYRQRDTHAQQQQQQQLVAPVTAAMVIGVVVVVFCGMKWVHATRKQVGNASRDLHKYAQ